MAVALVFAFLTFEAIRQGVTNAVITGFGVTVVALAGAAACLARLAHREEIVSIVDCVALPRLTRNGARHNENASRCPSCS